MSHCSKIYSTNKIKKDKYIKYKQNINIYLHYILKSILQFEIYLTRKQKLFSHNYVGSLSIYTDTECRMWGRQ